MEHIRYKKETEVVTFQGKEITLENLSPVFTPEQLRKLGVSNVLSPQKLDAMQFNGYSFERIGETIDGRTPYRIVQHQ